MHTSPDVTTHELALTPRYQPDAVMLPTTQLENNSPRWLKNAAVRQACDSFVLCIMFIVRAADLLPHEGPAPSSSLDWANSHGHPVFYYMDQAAPAKGTLPAKQFVRYRTRKICWILHGSTVHAWPNFAKLHIGHALPNNLSHTTQQGKDAELCRKVWSREHLTEFWVCLYMWYICTCFSFHWNILQIESHHGCWRIHDWAQMDQSVDPDPQMDKSMLSTHCTTVTGTTRSIPQIRTC
jgi:hypothetical protein